MKKNCDFCGKKLPKPYWIIRTGPRSPFHLNPGGLFRLCFKKCYKLALADNQAPVLAAGRLGEGVV